MPVLAPMQLPFQHHQQLTDTGIHHNQIKSYQVQQSLKHLREKAKEHEIELKKQLNTTTIATSSTNSSTSSGGNGPVMSERQRRESQSSQPKLISAETVSKNMQPNIHIQFNSIKTTAAAYAPLQQQHYFRNMNHYTSTPKPVLVHEKETAHNNDKDVHDRSFSENTYENCHIYENSKPRSKSVETYLNGTGKQTTRQQLAHIKGEKVCSSENLVHKHAVNFNNKRGKYFKFFVLNLKNFKFNNHKI
jgi:hypothetical protein